MSIKYKIIDIYLQYVDAIHIGFADKVDLYSHGVDNQSYMFTTAV